MVWDVVTLRESVGDRDRVTDMVRDKLIVTVGVPMLDGARVAAPLGERDNVMLLLCVSEVVGDVVPAFDAGTVTGGLGVMVDETQRLTVGDSVTDAQRLTVSETVLVRLRVSVTDMVGFEIPGVRPMSTPPVP